MQKLGLQDIPIKNLEEESLGLKDYVESLSEFILKCETPMTVAIQGDWGSGKTSLMNLIKENLKDDGKIHPIWFNTWQYSQFGLQDELTISLLSHFLDNLNASSDAKKLLSSVVSSGFKKFMKYLPAVADAATGELGKTLAEKANEMLSDTDPSKEITKLKKGIEEVVVKITGVNADKRIVVFIDDLDRLLPEKAVELLEVFKLFLDIPGCVFILACDYQVISQGLKQKFKLGVDDLKGKSFFDKIIQLPFHMPVSQYDVNQYINNILTRIGIEFSEKDLEMYTNIVDCSIGFNPRGMKRLFNSMLLLNEVAKRKQLYESDSMAKINDKQRILFATLCLQTAYEPIYQALCKNFDDELNNLLKLRYDEHEKDDEFIHKIKQELNDDDRDTKIIKFKDFLSTFFDCIDFDNKKEELSSDEQIVLEKMFNLSAITSTENFDSDERSSREVRSHLRSFGEDVIKDIKKIFYEYLKIKYSRDFKAIIPRGVESSLQLKLPINIVDFMDLQVVYFDILLTKDYMEFSLEGNKTAAQQWTNWFDEKCKKDFTEKISVQEKNKFLVLWKKEFDKNLKEEMRENQFKDEVIKSLNVIIPKLFKNKPC